MSVLVTKEAPEFKAQAVMPDGSFKEVSLSDYRGQYTVLFFYPLDFTFVCPTEIIAFSDRVKEFEALGVPSTVTSVTLHGGTRRVLKVELARSTIRLSPI